jgi:tetratricopeptide (TPR) repeat protein
VNFDDLELNPTQPPRRKRLRLKEEPADGPTCYRAAGDLRRAGRLGAAARQYERAIGYQEHNHAAWIELVDTLVRQRSIEDALRWAQRGVDGRRLARPLYAALACATAHQGDLAAAFELSDVSLDLERLWYPVCVRGELLLLKDPASKRMRLDALECFEEATRLASDPWEPHFIAGCALLHAGWAGHAAGYFAEALHLDPIGAAAWLGLGDCFAALKLHEQASFYFRQALDLEPFLEAAQQKQRTSRSAEFGLMKAFKAEELQRRWEMRYHVRAEDGAESTFD